MRPRLSVLSILLAATLAAQPPPGPWRFAGVPQIAYGSDVGLTLGLGAYMYRVAEVNPERRDRLSLGLAYTTRGPRFIEGRWYDFGVLGSRARMAWDARFADDNLAPYWGEGAQLGGLPISPGSGTPPPEFRYHDQRAFLSGLVVAPVVGPLGAFGRLRWLRIDMLAAGPLLAVERPPGVGGGDVALAEAGLVVDTRDQEVDTHRGLYVDASLFAAPALGGPFAFSFAGGNVTFRGYLPVRPAVLAMRLMADVKRGNVPFFERTMYEGIEFGDGLGGSSTIRGVARYRLAGQDKLLANLELRVDLLTLHPFDRSLEVGLASGVDAGAAHQPGYSAVAAVGGFAGVRLVWDRAVLVRVEVGYAAQGAAATYVAFGEEF